MAHAASWNFTFIIFDITFIYFKSLLIKVGQ